MAIYKVGVIPGDGIGPEVIKEALRVLNSLQDAIKGLRFEYVFCDAGLSCMEKYGTNLPEETIEKLKKTNVCLKGPLTTLEEPGAPPSATVTLRRLFDLYANVRPAKSLPNVPSLKPNIDLIVLRENTEGFYFAKEFEVMPGVGISTRLITKRACERIVRFAFNLSMKRKKHVTYVHKANILRLTDGIFKQVVAEIASKYPDVTVEELHIDAAAMQLIRRPESFDVIVTTNMFGDILSDEAAALVGGLGFAAGANIGDNYGMFEPVHGSAPKYAGKGLANPIAAILAAKLMLEYLGEEEAANRLEKAIFEVLKEGKIRTYDLGGNSTTSDMGKAVAKKVLEV